MTECNTCPWRYSGEPEGPIRALLTHNRVIHNRAPLNLGVPYVTVLPKAQIFREWLAGQPDMIPSSVFYKKVGEMDYSAHNAHKLVRSTGRRTGRA